jgi:Sulfotransferase domain
MSKGTRIAMWSGPRNISTAMMRAWGNRPDTVVIDEPFYGYFLKQTGADHPGADEIIAATETDWRKVVAKLTGPIPNGAPIFYQKLMTHHLLPQVSRDWLLEVTNCFLIRDPGEVIVSYLKKNGEPRLEDLGFAQQLEIFNFVREQSGEAPPVIDAKDVLHNPERTLRLLCQSLEVEFHRAMLSWPAGRRETDGIWAKYWYAEVERSTSFAPYREKNPAVPQHLRDLEERCREIYDRLYADRLCWSSRAKSRDPASPQ